MSPPFSCFLLLSFSFLLTPSCCYKVSFERLNSLEPAITSQENQNSDFYYNYNPSFLPLADGGQALLVRCQNLEDDNDIYAPDPSVIAAVNRKEPYSNIYEFEQITNDSVIICPNGDENDFGTEDPRVVYYEYDDTYYLLYSAVQSEPTVVSRLALAIAVRPRNGDIPFDWKRLGPIFGRNSTWSKSGAMLLQPPGKKQFLFWGDYNISIATADEPAGPWHKTGENLITPRSDHFDSALVESGPMPLPLSDGNFLFIYNSARDGYPSAKPGYSLQYNPGWVVLDGSLPTQIVERCNEPLASPQLVWETGTAPSLRLTPNVLFIEGWHPEKKKNDSFIVYYGGADSVVGVGRVTVEIE